jgi:hypothetical protein
MQSQPQPQPEENQPIIQLPELTTPETQRLREDYPSLEHLEAGNIGPWMIERQSQLMVRAKDERAGMNVAKLITLAGGAVGAIFYATNPLAIVGGMVAGVGYVWAVAQDLNQTSQFAPIPFVRGNLVAFLSAMGDKDAREDYFASQDELTDLMFHLTPMERYEFVMLQTHSQVLSSLLNRIPPGKRFYAYSWLLNWYIQLQGRFPKEAEILKHMEDISVDPRVNYDVVAALQDQQKKIPQLPNQNQSALPQASDGVSIMGASQTQSLKDWYSSDSKTIDVSAQSGEQVIDQDVVTHSNPQIVQIAQTILNTFRTHNSPCTFVDGVDGFKFWRILVRPETTTKIKNVIALGSELFSRLGMVIPDLPKAPLISQVKGGMIAVDVAKDMAQWRTAYLRDHILPEQRGVESPVKIPIGVNLAGELIELNVSAHNTRSMLTGGTSGGGKTAFTKAAICSLICQYPPSSLRLILSDVQKVDLEPFRNVPHLFAPLANTPQETVEALQAAEEEMNKRAPLFIEVGATNIDEYNAKVPKERQLPRFLIFVEEIADLVLNNKWASEFNRLQQSFNQVGRKWGFTLLISTQTPRVEVIPPHIRTLYPCFLAFMVSRRVESKIILGGESEDAFGLLGYGDAIFMTSLATERLQSLFVEQEEVIAIAKRVTELYGGDSGSATTSSSDLEQYYAYLRTIRDGGDCWSAFVRVHSELDQTLNADGTLNALFSLLSQDAQRVRSLSDGDDAPALANAWEKFEAHFFLLKGYSAGSPGEKKVILQKISLESSLSTPYEGADEAIESGDRVSGFQGSGESDFQGFRTSEFQSLTPENKASGADLREDYLEIRELRNQTPPKKKKEIIMESWGYSSHNYGEGDKRFLQALEAHADEWIEELARNDGLKARRIIERIWGARPNDTKIYPALEHKVVSLLQKLGLPWE